MVGQWGRANSWAGAAPSLSVAFLPGLDGDPALPQDLTSIFHSQMEALPPFLCCPPEVPSHHRLQLCPLGGPAILCPFLAVLSLPSPGPAITQVPVSSVNGLFSALAPDLPLPLFQDALGLVRTRSPPCSLWSVPASDRWNDSFSFVGTMPETSWATLIRSKASTDDFYQVFSQTLHLSLVLPGHL